MTADETRQIADYWNRIAPRFDAIYSGQKNHFARMGDRVFRRDMYQRFDWVMRKSGDVRGRTVCDVGCGSGRFVSALAQRGATVTGLDFAPAMLQLAKQLVEQDGVAARCDFVLTDILNWKTDRSFDEVIAIGFWDYVAEPLSRLKVIRQISRGVFLSAWPRAGTWRMVLRTVRLKLAGCPVYFWNEAEVRGLLAEAGFKVESCEIYGQLYCVAARAV
ncbi:MAG TPA: class I SAM-dependent methyltransferase [Terriglobales bacterium]|nr:class I SAM-dependent methyltransferase [Terriglobales bacterium]